MYYKYFGKEMSARLKYCAVILFRLKKDASFTLCLLFLHTNQEINMQMLDLQTLLG